MPVSSLEFSGPCSLLTLSDLAQLLKISERKIRTMMSQGELPKPIVLGQRGFRWRSTDLEKYLQGL